MSRMNPKKEDLRSKNKVVNGITYFYSINKEEVTVGEYSDNPHGVNSAASCSIQDLLDKNEEGLRCRNNITLYFGEETLNELINQFV